MPSSCVGIFGTTINGAPVLPRIAQQVYDVRNASWYLQMVNIGIPLLYGSTAEFQYQTQGLVFGLPIFNNVSGLIGAVEVFVQTTLVEQVVNSLTGNFANVSYIMNAAHFLIATSIGSQNFPYVINDTIRVSATNCQNNVISVSATYLVNEGINAAGTFVVPYEHGFMEVSQNTITLLQGVDFHWKIVTVVMLPAVTTAVVVVLPPSLSPTTAPSPTVAPSSSSVGTVTSASVSTSSSSLLTTQSGLAVAGIVLGCLAVVVVAGGVGWWLLVAKTVRDVSRQPPPSEGVVEMNPMKLP